MPFVHRVSDEPLAHARPEGPLVVRTRIGQQRAPRW